MTSVKGTYKNGRIEFAEPLPNPMHEGEVIVTFLSETQEERKPLDLYGIGKGRIPDETDIESLRREVVSEWKHEAEGFADAA